MLLCQSPSQMEPSAQICLPNPSLWLFDHWPWQTTPFSSSLGAGMSASEIFGIWKGPSLLYVSFTVPGHKSGSQQNLGVKSGQGARFSLRTTFVDDFLSTFSQVSQLPIFQILQNPLKKLLLQLAINLQLECPPKIKFIKNNCMFFIFFLCLHLTQVFFFHYKRKFIFFLSLSSLNEIKHPILQSLYEWWYNLNNQVIKFFRYKQKLIIIIPWAKMQDKTTLINSMNNLINHISISRKNQQQMFISLTRKDFDKIISNLDDSLLKLRITTVKLLTQLLYNNIGLKQKFCQLMNIHCTKNANVVLNGNFEKLMQKYSKKQKEIFVILKEHNKKTMEQQETSRNGGKQPLLWFINLKNNKLCVQYVQRQQFAFLSNYPANRSINFDPIDCIFGIALVANDVQSGFDNRISTNVSTAVSQSRKGVNQEIEITQDSFTHRQANYLPAHMPMSAKNSVFMKQNNPKVGNYSFTHQSPQPPYEIKNSFREGPKIGRFQQAPMPLSPEGPQYLNMSMNLQIQPHSCTSKKENEERHTLVQKDKYSNRLSLQINDFKAGHRKVNTFQNESGSSHPQTSREATTPSEHHHGIKLMTPRQSLKISHKISVVNNGAYTQRAYTERHPTTSSIVDREKGYEPKDGTLNTQRIKTIHLGGIRGAETARDKKNIKIQRH